MKIYIFADMEGISGISGSDFVIREGALYQAGRKYYTMDINACVRGCLKAGATEIIVRDGHSSGNHALWNELKPEIELVQGATPNKRLPGIEGADGIIFLGYHAMAGVTGALLEHTYSSAAIQNIWLNGKKTGEFGIDSVIAQEYGVPTIMVSGDDKVCAEAEAFIPGLVTCQVKESYSCQGTKLLPMKKAHKLIEEKTIEAIGKIGSIDMPKLEKPYTLRREAVERGYAKTGNDIKLIDARTNEISGDCLEELFYKLLW